MESGLYTYNHEALWELITPPLFIPKLGICLYRQFESLNRTQTFQRIDYIIRLLEYH